MEIYLEGILVAMRGAAKTLGVSFFALLVGAALGLGFALMKKSHNRPVRILSEASGLSSSMALMRFVKYL